MKNLIEVGHEKHTALYNEIAKRGLADLEKDDYSFEQIDIDAFTEQYLVDTDQGSVKVLSYEFDTARILRELDPIAWGCLIDEVLENSMSEGHVVESNGVHYAVVSV